MKPQQSKCWPSNLDQFSLGALACLSSWLICHPRLVRLFRLHEVLWCWCLHSARWAGTWSTAVIKTIVRFMDWNSSQMIKLYRGIFWVFLFCMTSCTKEAMRWYLFNQHCLAECLCLQLGCVLTFRAAKKTALCQTQTWHSNPHSAHLLSCCLFDLDYISHIYSYLPKMQISDGKKFHAPLPLHLGKSLGSKSVGNHFLCHPMSYPLRPTSHCCAFLIFLCKIQSILQPSVLILLLSRPLPIVHLKEGTAPDNCPKMMTPNRWCWLMFLDVAHRRSHDMPRLADSKTGRQNRQFLSCFLIHLLIPFTQKCKKGSASDLLCPPIWGISKTTLNGLNMFKL